MGLEARDVIQLLVILCGAVATIATMRSESRRQSEQHAELKRETTSRLDSLGRKVDGLSGTISSIMADSREHQVRITGLEARMVRAEGHLDEFGRLVFSKRGGSDDRPASS